MDAKLNAYVGFSLSCTLKVYFSECFVFFAGGRMYYDTQNILLRRKLEQAEFQQAIELQGQRLMNLQLPGFKNDRTSHHQRSLSVGAPVHLPPQSLSLTNQNVILPFDSNKQEEVTEGLLIDEPSYINLVLLSF